ncbi:ABC transporter permease [Methylophilaceae bacterium]|jgi:peptide/nickel transport system permease protein|nr:ABC transporter permease [Methylophilaceae bacterium]|tara:strand:+ start:782 stop:1702 length:921 start_codon:yes stop_codon:yes gene_type:complete
MKNNLPTILFASLLQVLGIFIISFLILHLLPGDPIQVMLGESAALSDQFKLRAELGLDQPIYKQIFSSITKIMNGDFGNSILTGVPIKEQIIIAMKNTYILALMALFIAITFGITGGLVAAKYRDSFLDKIIINFSLFFISIPHFFLGPLLMLCLSIWLGWLPISGMDSTFSIILPALTLSLGMLAIIVKMTRNCMIEIIDSDAVRTARAKGMQEWSIMINHVFRLILIPLITIIGMQFGSLLSGAIITETLFSWNGLGMLLVNSIQMRDYPITQACIFVIAISYVLVNLLTEILYKIVDPRMRGI